MTPCHIEFVANLRNERPAANGNALGPFLVAGLTAGQEGPGERSAGEARAAVERSGPIRGAVQLSGSGAGAHGFARRLEKDTRLQAQLQAVLNCINIKT